MVARTVCLTLWCSLAIWGLVSPAWAQNGAVAIAVPVEGIAIDGDLSDWPADMRTYPIALTVWGNEPKDNADFQGSFRVGYNGHENALYIAVQVADEFTVIDNTDQPAPWNTQDGCEVYLAFDHPGEIYPVQFSIWGNRYFEGLTERQHPPAKWQHPIGKHLYEWRLELGKISGQAMHVAPGMVLGLDVTALDRDEDGSIAQMAWGKGFFKRLARDRIGYVVLLGKEVRPEDEATLMKGLTERMLVERSARDRQDAGYQAFFSTLFLAVALVYFLVYLLGFRQRIYLLFAAAGIIFSASTFVGYELSGVYVPSLYILSLVLTIALFFFLMLTIYELFLGKVPRRFWVFLIALIGVGGFNIVDRFEGYYSGMMLFALEVVFVVDALGIACRAVLNKKPGALLVGVGFFFFSVTLIVGFLRAFFEDVNISPQFYDWGGLGVFGSLAIYLAQRFVETNRDLEHQLVQVKELSTQALEQEQQLRDEQVQRRVLEEELQTAHEMQMGLMPKESPQVPGFKLAGRCLPANHVGGDFYQYFLQDGKLRLALADVTGHAMEAAIPVVMFSGMLKGQVEVGGAPQEILGRLNRSLHGTLNTRTLVCFALGEVDLVTHILRFSNSGIPYPYHYQATTGEVTELQVDAYPLGTRSDTAYRAVEVPLASGDRVVFCSDGIIEATNAVGEMFGFERTRELIYRGASEGLAADSLIESIIAEVKAFSGGATQGDDQTVVVLQVDVGKNM